MSEANQLSSTGFLGQVNSQARNAAKKISEVVQDMEMKKEEVETTSQLFVFVDQVRTVYSIQYAGVQNEQGKLYRRDVQMSNFKILVSHPNPRRSKF